MDTGFVPSVIGFNIALFIIRRIHLTEIIMDKIDQAIEYCEMELESLTNPGTYMDSEYYVRCAAKAEAFADMASYLQKLKREK